MPASKGLKIAVAASSGLVLLLSGCASGTSEEAVEVVEVAETDTPVMAWENGYAFADSLKDSYPELLASNNSGMKALYSKGDMPSAMALEVHFKFTAAYVNPCGRGGLDKYPDDFDLALDFDHGCFAGLGYNLPKPS